jgi:uncharacterized damage-inducible protein DinB
MHPVRALFEREAWANRELLRRGAELDPELLARETPGTYGTIPRTLTHIVSGEQFFLTLLTGQAAADLIEHGEQRDPAAGGPVGEWADALLLRFFEYAGWAADRVLEHSVGLGEAALQATAPGTYGTVHETLTHLVDAHCDYLSRLAGEEADFLEGAVEPDVLRRWLEWSRQGWTAYLEAGPDHGRMAPTAGRDAPAWVVTMQAVHHLNDHLAHVGTILGANDLPVPSADVWAYVLPPDT